MSNSLKKHFIKTFKVLMLLIILLNFNYKEVNASSIKVSEGHWVELQKDYGLDASGTSHKRTSYKRSGGKPVFCIQFKKQFSGGTFSTGKCNFSLSKKHEIIAGKIVDIVYSKNWSGDKKYAYAVASLNTYMRKYKNLSSSASFGEKGTIKEIIDEAKKYYEDLNKAYPKPGVVNNIRTLSMLGSDGKSFITTEKVVFNNLVDKWMDTNSKYSFSVVNGASGVNYYLCTDKTGKNCTKVSETNYDGDDKVSYYVKVTSSNQISKHNFSIKITGNVNDVKYYTSNIYCKGSNQAVLKKASGKKNYSASVSTSFKVPSTNERELEIKKVDENGEAIKGAEFALYKGDNCSSNALTLTKNSDGTIFSYSTGIITNDDSFYGNYSFKETKSPSGYITDNNCSTVNIEKNDSTTCYNSDGEDVESDYCNSSISYKCKVEVPSVTVTNPDTGEETTTEGSTNYEDFNETGCVSSTNEQNITTTRTKVCYDGSNSSEVNDKYCSNQSDYSLVTVKSGNVLIQKQNQKNTVVISKKAITGDEEVAGANLKICSKSDYESKKTDCTASKTINDVSLEWVSGDDEATFMGINPGSYVIIETIPPVGYKIVNTVTEFSIDEAGVIKTGGTNATDNMIVVKNSLTEMTISKTDIATSKELPGAKLSICSTSIKLDDSNNEDSNDNETTNADNNENEEAAEDAGDEEAVEGDTASSAVPKLFYYKSLDVKKFEVDLDLDKDCVPAILADGSDATWESGNEPHKIVGLPAGVYYLVEKISPDGYDTAESIGFIMQSDGTLTDFNGNSLKDNKIVMQDKPLTLTKTGQLKIILVFLIATGGISTYVYFNKKKNNININNDSNGSSAEI